MAYFSNYRSLSHSALSAPQIHKTETTAMWKYPDILKAGRHGLFEDDYLSSSSYGSPISHHHDNYHYPDNHHHHHLSPHLHDSQSILERHQNDPRYTVKDFMRHYQRSKRDHPTSQVYHPSPIHHNHTIHHSPLNNHLSDLHQPTYSSELDYFPDSKRDYTRDLKHNSSYMKEDYGDLNPEWPSIHSPLLTSPIHTSPYNLPSSLKRRSHTVASVTSEFELSNPDPPIGRWRRSYCQPTNQSIATDVNQKYKRYSYNYPPSAKFDYYTNQYGGQLTASRHKNEIIPRIGSSTHHKIGDFKINTIRENIPLVIDEDYHVRDGWIEDCGDRGGRDGGLYEDRMGELRKLNKMLDEKIELNALTTKEESDNATTTKNLHSNEDSNKDHHSNRATQGTTNGMKDEELIKLVLQPGETFNPDEVSRDLLPSGCQATVYKQTKQKVHNKPPDLSDWRRDYLPDHATDSLEDKRLAEKAIESFSLETDKMKEDLGTLDDFIRKNKALFPPNLIIIQHFLYHKPSPRKFFDTLDNEYDDLFSSLELVARMGFHDNPCRVKVKETLVVPKGCDLRGYDVEGVLERCYHRNEDVEVVYEDEEGMRRTLKEGREKQQEEMKKRDVEDGFRLKLNDNYTKIDNENDTINIFNRNKQMVAEYNYPKKGGGSDGDGGNKDNATKDQIYTSELPIFLAELSNQRVLESQEVTLTCKVQGHIEVAWYKDHGVLRDGGKFHMKVTPSECSLQLSSCSYEDQGLYELHAANQNGVVVTKATLNVILTSETPKVGLSFLSKPPSCVQVTEGHLLNLTFLLESCSPPQVTWYKGVIEIQDGVHQRPETDTCYRIKAETDWKHVMEIEKVRLTDAGLYSLSANVGGAKLSQSVLLEVEPPSKRGFKVEAKHHEHIKMKPIFIQQLPSEHHLTQGQDLLIGCTVDEAEKEELDFAPSTRDTAAATASTFTSPATTSSAVISPAVDMTSQSPATALVPSCVDAADIASSPPSATLASLATTTAEILPPEHIPSMICVSQSPDVINYGAQAGHGCAAGAGHGEGASHGDIGSHGDVGSHGDIGGQGDVGGQVGSDAHDGGGHGGHDGGGHGGGVTNIGNGFGEQIVTGAEVGFSAEKADAKPSTTPDNGDAGDMEKATETRKYVKALNDDGDDEGNQR